MPTQQASPAAQFAALLTRYPPECVAVAKRCLTKLRRLLPGSNRIVYGYASSLVVSFSMSEHGYEAIVAVAVTARGVQLYFDKSLPDPNRRLKGSGGKVRSVTLNAASDFDHADIQALIQAAIAQSGAGNAAGGKGRMIFKSASM